MVAQGNGDAITAAARTSMLTTAAAHAKKTIPANFLSYLGQTLRVEAHGRISSLITTPGTARFDLAFGATVVFDGLAILLDTIAGHTNVGWKLVLDLTVRAVGGTANLFGGGTWTCEDILGVPATAPKGVLTAMLPWNTAPAVGANFDSTASQQIDLFFTQTVATGSVQLHQYTLSAPNGY
jgi:hypothetical protein